MAYSVQASLARVQDLSAGAFFGAPRGLEGNVLFIAPPRPCTASAMAPRGFLTENFSNIMVASPGSNFDVRCRASSMPHWLAQVTGCLGKAEMPPVLLFKYEPLEDLTCPYSFAELLDLSEPADSSHPLRGAHLIVGSMGHELPLLTSMAPIPRQLFEALGNPFLMTLHQVSWLLSLARGSFPDLFLANDNALGYRSTLNQLIEAVFTLWTLGEIDNSGCVLTGRLIDWTLREPRFLSEGETRKHEASCELTRCLGASILRGCHSLWFCMPLAVLLTGAAHNSFRDLVRSHPQCRHLQSSILQGTAPRELLVATSDRPPVQMFEVLPSMVTSVKLLFKLCEWEHLADVPCHSVELSKRAQVEAISKDSRLRLRGPDDSGVSDGIVTSPQGIYSAMALHTSVRALSASAPGITAASPWATRRADLAQALARGAPEDYDFLPSLLQQLLDLEVNSELPSLHRWLRILDGTPASLAERMEVQELMATQAY